MAVNFHLGFSLQLSRGYIADAPVPLDDLSCQIRNNAMIAKTYISNPRMRFLIWFMDARELA